MSDARTVLQMRLDTLVRSDLEPAALLRELETLAQNKVFQDFANVWAPVLCERDIQLFETFLLRNLEGYRHAAVIRAILPRVEAAGREGLFQQLYRMIVEESDWSKELLALAQSEASDEQVLQAVQRREVPGMDLGLTEPTALALYRRNPKRFRAFIQAHVLRWWGSNQNRFARLRKEARAQGDDELSWALFRIFADTREWKEEMQRLLHQDVPADQIVAELRKRHPLYYSGVYAGYLVNFVVKFGAAVLPYVEENVHWIARTDGKRLLRAGERLGNDPVWWRIFFRVGEPKQWNEALRQLLQQSWTDEELLRELQMHAPAQAGRPWHLEPDVTLALYQRNPILFRPFLERLFGEVDQGLQLELFKAAGDRDDQEFLDFLCYRYLYGASVLGANLVRLENDPPFLTKVRQALDLIGQLLTVRFDQLCVQSADTYVRHAANILSRFQAFEIRGVKQERKHNVGLVYLMDRHHDAWRSSPDGIRELLASPNDCVQIIGLNMLTSGGPQAAQRVLENLPVLRALLLGQAWRNTKKRVLTCLEQAARQGPEFADRILPLLEEAMGYRGKRAIAERIMVSFVRLRRQKSSEWAKAPSRIQ